VFDRTGAHPEAGLFTYLDLYFADWMVRLSSGAATDPPADLWFAAALASNAVSKGHICASLSDWAGKPVEHPQGTQTQGRQYPDLLAWVDRLKRAPVVGAPGEFKPLILDEKHRLYLQRYWTYEGQLADVLLAKAQSRKRSIDEQLLRDGLQRFFPQAGEEEVNWQQVAAVAAILNGLTIISGGPGTGKTFTMAKILALMVEQARGRRPAVALAAPTGKAAARLKGVIRERKGDLNCSVEVKALIPEETSTIHRLLGPTRSGSFRYNKSNPLPYDVVAIDETSMSDLPLMAKLASALKGDTQLILLGDKEQLASVEPGAVFGDICEAAGTNTFSPAFRQHFRRLSRCALPEARGNPSALTDSAVLLEKNYRFGAQSGIGILSALVNMGDGRAALELLKMGGFADISWQDVPPAEKLARAMERHSLVYHADCLKADGPVSAFTLFNRFHMLCALREGPYGVVSVNQMIQQLCARRGLIRREGRWYRGQPLLVTANDYRLRLFNGDVGILLDDPETASLRVFFPSEEGAFRKILPGRLAACETAHAITVHKSQGSEFEHILVLLPDRHSEVVTRELIYTAITRARKRVEVWGRDEVFVEAVSSRTRRTSGLQDRLRSGME
jgi:exodeoxyribonuclease V alpha subunit